MNSRKLILMLAVVLAPGSLLAPLQMLAQESPEGTAKLVLETRHPAPKPPPLYTATVRSKAKVSESSVAHVIEVTVDVVRGKAESVEFELRGDGTITDVAGESVQAWAVRKQGQGRYLVVTFSDALEKAKITVQAESGTSPSSQLDFLHLGPGKAIGFGNLLRIDVPASLQAKLLKIEGFTAAESKPRVIELQTISGGEIRLAIARSSAAQPDIELQNALLTGELHPSGKSVDFLFEAKVIVRKPGAIPWLSGNVAVSSLPESESYRLRLPSASSPSAYQLVFDEAGEFDVSLDFVSAVLADSSGWEGLQFQVATGAIVPIELSGIAKEVTFQRAGERVVPALEGDLWRGFLPANGRTNISWKTTRKTGEGKLFFTTTGRTETGISAGLLKQFHHIHYRVLQGQLAKLEVEVHGPGEILDVQGSGIVGWDAEEATEDGDGKMIRRLTMTLNQAINKESNILIRTQSPLGAFPVTVDTISIHPLGAIRHSGFIRVTNIGAVRVEPTDLQGLTQLSPDQFPGNPLQGRQVFAYRFPSSAHSMRIAADQIQPEVSVAQVVVYSLSESDRTITADVEFDIREAPIREWDIGLPADYSVVSVTGASVADYLVASETVEGRKNLTVILSGDVQGRQLVSISLEKNAAATEATWELPKLTYPEAKAVTGNIGIVSAPGFRVGIESTELLVEKPLSYFPKQVKNLQQAFRIREPAWSATLAIEVLQRSVQSDVFHLYSLSQGVVYGSSLVNYFITGSPVSELTIEVPETLGNVVLDGQDIRTWRRDGENIVVSLHQGVMGSYTLLLTFEQEPVGGAGVVQAGQITPVGVAGERGYIQVVSPMQVEVETLAMTEDLLVLDPLELPAEFRLLSTAPALGTWQYTQRPFTLDLKVNWFQPGTTVGQVVEYAEANSRVSVDGELVTDVVYYVKSRGQRNLRITLPGAPVKLWAASVNGQPVSARQAGAETLIPLPGGVDPNLPVEVSLRLGKPAVAGPPTLILPVVSVPVLKTSWEVSGDEQQVLLPLAATIQPPEPVVRPSGLNWIARLDGLVFVMFIGALVVAGGFLSQTNWLRIPGIACFVVAAVVSFNAAQVAEQDAVPAAALQLSVPVLAAGEAIEMQVRSVPAWQVGISWPGVAAILGGLILLLLSCRRLVGGSDPESSRLAQQWRFFRIAGILGCCVGTLLQADGAGYFFNFVAWALAILVVVPLSFFELRRLLGVVKVVWRDRRARAAEREATTGDAESSGVATTILVLLTSTFSFGLPTNGAQAFQKQAASRSKSSQQSESTSLSSTIGNYHAADSILQQWDVSSKDARLVASGSMKVTGQAGDQFVLLYSPAVLTGFESDELRVSKTAIGGRSAYVVTIPLPAQREPATGDASNEPETDSESDGQESDGQETDEGAKEDSNTDEDADESQVEDETLRTWSAEFKFQIESVDVKAGVPVMSGVAAVQQLKVRFDEAAWNLASASAIRIDQENQEVSEWDVLLGASGGTLVFSPRVRDVAGEETKFFVEGANLYIPGPGVVDGIHRLNIRPSQGEVRELNVSIPEGLTVSSVDGPIASWQFDADTRSLKLVVEPAQSVGFSLDILTQRGLGSLPSEVTLAPLRVADSGGEVGLLALAFGNDAQPEKATTQTLSMVSLTDFDPGLLPESKPTLYRVYRFGKSGGSVTLRVAPVEPEVRVASKEVLSIGDERLVLGVNFAVDIARAGLFQLSFPLPDGLEVESLSGAALDHWSELTTDDARIIVLHLGSKTLGRYEFSLTLAGAAPAAGGEWTVPRFTLREAKRQTGELAIRPTTGIRLRTTARQNASEIDPREMGGSPQGSLAFRLLQKDWNISLGIEQLAPWVTGGVLQEVTIREGQTRTRLVADFNVQNASIRSLKVALPISAEDELKTLRATGDIISDFAPTAADSNIWELQFKRRVVGKFRFQIEYERRGQRDDESEQLVPFDFPETRQLAYYFAVRAGGRLELEHGGLSQGWQEADWNTVPQELRDSGDRSAPALTLRAVAPPNPLRITATRHSLADSLKLRVASGQLTTILSPTGDHLTAVDVTMEVVQRSSLSVKLPTGGELFSIFVNGESVHSIRDASSDAWQFYILPGIDDRTAEVRFVYSVKGESLTGLKLAGPLLNVPLENIRWNVVAPRGFELVSNEGNLELVSDDVHADAEAVYDRQAYLSKVSGNRQVQEQQAEELLQQANQLLQSGQQTKARRALNSVTNQYALDAASNEDARVLLENLQTQQAIVGLNTRRQRLYLDNNLNDSQQLENEQFMQAAAGNPILQQQDVNFLPQQLSQLLQGNSSEDNAVLLRIAGRLVQHQRSTEPAPQAIIISLPEDGAVYEFSRTVQVSEKAPLELELTLDSQYRLPQWQAALAIALLLIIASAFVLPYSRRETVTEGQAG